MSDVAPLVGTLVIGPRNVIEDVDAAGCSLLGYSKRELIGMHGSELIRAEERPATAASLDRMRHGDLSFRPARLRCKDGSLVEVEVHAQRLPNRRLALTVRTRSKPQP